MLTNEQKEYLIKYHESNENAEKTANFAGLANMRQMNKRIRDKALNMLEDLVLIAKTMPESQKEQIFTKDLLRDFVIAVIKDSENYYTIENLEDEGRLKLPEPIYNSRIFDLGALFADKGIDSAYNMISWKLRIKDQLRLPSKEEKLELIDALDNFGGMYAKKI